MSHYCKNIVIFMIAVFFGYHVSMRDDVPETQMYNTQDMAMLFAHHKFSDDFWAWELEKRLKLVDQLVRDPVLSQARYQWGLGEINKVQRLNIARHIRDIQVAAYRDTHKLSGITAPYLGFAALWVKDARGLYQQAQDMILVNDSVDWAALPFDDFVATILHETAHHIYADLGRRMQDDAYAQSVSADFCDDAVILWLNTPQGGHVYFGDYYTLNPQERLAWDAQNMARFVGLEERRAVPLSSLTQRFKELENLKARWFRSAKS